MSVTIVVGAQWGDEAKGKMVDLLSKNADVVARFNGGDNAGHTVVNELGTFKLRLIPNGIANPNTQCVIGAGVVVNLATLAQEIDYISSKGIDLLPRLWISPRCHVVMPYHPLIEEIYEEAKGSGSTGTTRRGMGPVYADKASYNGIRLFDFADRSRLEAKLRAQLAVKNAFIQTLGEEALILDRVLDEKLEQYSHIKKAVREPFGMLQSALDDQASIVLEGAQGALLDNDWGTYPFCTASTTLAGGSAAGLGIASKWVTRVMGVAKAYTSRVGSGPMPTELFDETGETLRREGKEFGTVTGRPRRCGWFDAELVHFAARLNGFTEIALTKLDVLDKLPVIKIAVGYRQKGDSGRIFHYWEGDAYTLKEGEPVYEEMEGWLSPTTGIREFDRLPIQAQDYVRRIEALVETPVMYVSVGPGRDEIIRMR
jgi:adenylosuccinate synthase